MSRETATETGDTVGGMSDTQGQEKPSAVTPDQDTSTYQDAAPQGPLLDLDEEAAAKLADRLWMRDEKAMVNRKERWKVNRLRRMGNWMARLKWDKMQDRAIAYVPPGANIIPPAMNKMARLCRRMIAILFVDPPIAEVTPSSDSEEDRDAAELAERILWVEGSAGKVDVANVARRAASIGCDAGSGFVRVWTDPAGGGQQPKAIQCRPGATSPDDALVDPVTGQPWMGETHTMYVTPDGQLTKEATEADRQWLPGLCTEILDGRKVRFIPHTAYNIDEARGIIIGTMKPLGELKQMAGIGDVIKAMDDQDIQALVSYRLPGKDDLIDGHKGDKGTNQGWGAGMTEETKDEQLVTLLTVYHEATPQYPKGCYAVFGGKKFRLLGEAWCDPETSEGLSIPLAQFKQLDEGDEDDPYGYGLSDTLGAPNELRGGQIAAWSVWLDRLNRLKWLIPTTSMVQAAELQNPTATAIAYHPGGGEPKMQQIGEYPQAAPQFLNFITTEMDDESGLSASAQGLNPPEVQSGIHAQQLIEQTVVGLSSIKQNTESGIIRLYRIMLEQIRAFYDGQQTLQIVGDDGQSKQEHWERADLRDATDVRIQRGSMSMLSPSSKAAVAEHLFSLHLIDQEELRRMALANAGGVMALEDDPHRQRIARQIAEWEEGPPEGWAPPVPPIDPATGGPQVDPQTGQPAQAQDAALAQIWAPRPSDVMPAVASIRLNALARLISGTCYGSKPIGWLSAVDAEFARMNKAVSDAQPKEEPKKNISTTINYADLPPDVQREEEAAVGLQPSQMPPEQIAMIQALKKPQPAIRPGGTPGAPKTPDSASGEPLPKGVKNLAAAPPSMPAAPPM